MAKVAAITLALLASASSLAWAQNADKGMGGAPAPATAMPGGAAPAGFTIDQKGVKRATAPAPAPAGARKAAPLPGKAAVGTAANPTPDGSGNKSFFESRSNTNPRANTGAAAKSVPESAPSAGSAFKN